jgi:mRNA-degrading endonuclease YafQ of YafQ-DinJ toxin-antitoxin module
MKISKVHITSDFKKSYNHLPRNVQTLADKKDVWFKENPYDLRLRTHKLKGELEGYWAYSVDYHHRIIFKFLDNNEAIYYDIGTHEIYR